MFRAVLLMLVLAAVAAPSDAQRSAVRLGVTPSVGFLAPFPTGSSLDAVTNSGSVHARMTAGPAAGMSLEIGLPSPVLDLRVSLGASLSSVRFTNWDGEFRTEDRHVHYGNPVGSGSALILANAAAVVHPWPGSGRPYLMGGGGIKHYRLANLPRDLDDVLDEDGTRPAAHLGVGMALGRGFQLELVSHVARQAMVFRIPELRRIGEPERWQSHLVLSLGYRARPLR